MSPQPRVGIGAAAATNHDAMNVKNRSLQASGVPRRDVVIVFGNADEVTE